MTRKELYEIRRKIFEAELALRTAQEMLQPHTVAGWCSSQIDRALDAVQHAMPTEGSFPLEENNANPAS